MFHFDPTEYAAGVGTLGAGAAVTDTQFVEQEIRRFLGSSRRQEMLTGVRYYEGRQDILQRRRTAIGEDGEPVEVKALPNNRIVDNQFRKMVNQKTNYLVGQPVVFRTSSDRYAAALREVFDAVFGRQLKRAVRDLLCQGIVWLVPYYDETGALRFGRIPGYDVIPGWRDADHTQLDYVIHVYPVMAYEKAGGQVQTKTVQKVEVYDAGGIHYFTLADDGRLMPDTPFAGSNFTVLGADGQEAGYNWERLPFVPLRYNDGEIPLLRNVKSLQDARNVILSNFENGMEEDVHNTILVVVNYDGENLGEFRKNLSTYGAVKVNTVDGAAGDLRTLQIEVNAENYKTIAELLKKAIIENAMGYDAKDDRLGGNANQLNIMSMYSDIDLDANDMETELQASFRELLWFVNAHLANTGTGSFESEAIEIIFNRDMLISETEVIANCAASQGIISDETILANHPWVDDPAKELERMAEQKRKNMEQYGGFPGGEKDGENSSL